MNRVIRNTGFYLLIFLVTVGIVHFISSQNDQKDELTYDQFRKELQAGNIKEIRIKFDGWTYYVNGDYVNPPQAHKPSFVTRTPVDERVIAQLESSGITERWEKMEGDNMWIAFLTSIVPFIIIFILFFFLLNQAQGGGGKVMNFGKSRARLYNEEKKTRYV